MANHKSAEKRIRQNLKRRIRNKMRKTRIKNLIRAFEESLKAKDLAAAEERLKLAQKIIDKTASKGTLHWKTAARKISRLYKKLNNLKKAF